MKDCFIPDAELLLVDDNGNTDILGRLFCPPRFDIANRKPEGELHIRSKLISRGYHNYESSAFSINSDGVITFRTGDVYERILSPRGDRLLWKGRKEDFIQMVSGENLDPRPREKVLDSCEAISRSCIVGNNFLQGAAQHVCAIIEPVPSGRKVTEIFNAIASVNRNLIPSLRIAWSRTLILEEGETIPINRKGLIFRKQLQSLFGERLARLLADPSTAPSINAAPLAEVKSSLTLQQISDIVRDAVCAGLGISKEIIEAHSESTFAEACARFYSVAFDIKASFTFLISWEWTPEWPWPLSTP
jgi:hypothetical protein